MLSSIAFKAEVSLAGIIQHGGRKLDRLPYSSLDTGVGE